MTDKADPLQTPSSPSTAALQDAVAAHRSGRLEDAASLYGQVLAAEPTHADANHLMGLLQAQAGRTLEALRFLQAAIAAAPGVPAYHVTLANALLALGRLDEAANACGAAIARDPNCAPAHLCRGNVMVRRQDLAEAARCYRRVIELDPDQIEAHMNLGNVLAEIGEPEEAVACFRQVLAIDPNLAQAHYNLGNALKAQGALQEAAVSYRAAVGLAPDLTAAHLNLGNVLGDLGWHADAAAHYREVLRLDPKHGAAYARLGDILRSGNEVDEAVACYQAALRLEPENPRAHYNLGRGLRARGETEAAIACYRGAIERDPGFAAAHASLGDAYRSLGALEDAAAGYRRALELDPEYTDARTNLALTFQQMGRFDAALREFAEVGGRVGRARVLECLFVADQRDDFRKALVQERNHDPCNLRVAAISAFAAHQWGLEDGYPFCPRPLEAISKTDVRDALPSFETFVSEILEEIEGAPAVWNPRGNATKGGFHTTGNLFHLDTPRIAELHDVILDRIADYRSHAANGDDVFSTHWPRKAHLYGWHVKMLESGYMDPHIHTSGWVSGVIYLRMPNNLEADEGSISFSLHGYDYPIRNPDIPTVRHHPRAGDLVLFPSSLFHRTDLFRGDDYRHCIAFDLCPDGQ